MESTGLVTDLIREARRGRHHRAVFQLWYWMDGSFLSQGREVGRAGFCGQMIIPFGHIDFEVPVGHDMEMSVGHSV